MPPSLRVDVVVPVRDHAASLGMLLDDLPTRGIRSVVVVDRDSRDRSAEIARDRGALVLRAPGRGGYGAACLRAQAHFSSLPKVPDIVVFIPGDRPAAASQVLALIDPIVERGVELVVGVEQGHHAFGEKIVKRLIETVYRHRWSGVGAVRAMRYPAMIALGMSDKSDGWDVEMLVRAVKLGLSCDEIVLPPDDRSPRARGSSRIGGYTRALLHILRHSTMR